ncbi:hypothetical protein GPEL0_01r1652 [Geoanaerobacter pelophilus]|uniref:Uncharacterized protein n=1 Tax=Geoanaerobacter pelophilus TaxID=60036 RepID=A0ABQ0MGV9_9BACT|nr:hypothetical protein GPEL0_01r1652 [Geoanaerobacter pelophilus]
MIGAAASAALALHRSIIMLSTTRIFLIFPPQKRFQLNRYKSNTK